MLIAPLFGTRKPPLCKTGFIVGAITSLNDAIAPGTGLFDEGVDAPIFFHSFRERRFSFGMWGILPGEIHRISSKRYEKGGNASNTRWYTAAIVWLVQSAWISEYFQRVARWIKLILYSNPACPLIAGNCCTSPCKRCLPTGIRQFGFVRPAVFFVRPARCRISATVPRWANGNCVCNASASGIAPAVGLAWR